jgi:hypothetical protein
MLCGAQYTISMFLGEITTLDFADILEAAKLVAGRFARRVTTATKISDSVGRTASPNSLEPQAPLGAGHSAAEGIPAKFVRIYTSG